ncbi:unnamed protein product, partial [Ascophyllum nodosum]
MASPINANAVLCVKGEIHNVLTVLRLNSRWASRERFSREVPLQAESPLSRAFKGLHSHLEEVDDLANVDTVRYLLPFLAVVESPATTGPMTGVALSSLHKFLLYGFIRKDCPRVKEGITLVAQAIGRCHFEETNPESDALVLMKLLELSALCLRCEVGDLLEDDSCWNIFVACYNLYNITTGDKKAYGLLRDTAGNTLAHIVLMLFSCPRVSRASVASISGSASLPVPAAVPSSASSSAAATPPDGRGDGGSSSGVHQTVDGRLETPVFAERGDPDPSRPRPGGSGGDGDGGGGGGGRQEEFVGRGRDNGEGDTEQRHQQLEQEEEPWPSLELPRDGNGGRFGASPARARRGELWQGKENANGSGNSDGGGFGQEAGGGESGGGEDQSKSVLVRVMRFLSLLSDPRSNGRAECVLSLSLINIALEAGGGDLGRIPALVRVMRGDLCKHLLQNSQTEDLNVLSLTLRVVFNLFNSIKDHLKIQLEVFLTSVHLRVLDGTSYGPEQQELALESLLEFTREPALMVDVYINYDCDVQCTNLFESICHSLSTHALPRDGKARLKQRTLGEVTALNRLALEGVLAVINSISRRCQPRSQHHQHYPQHHQQRHQQQRTRTPFSGGSGTRTGTTGGVGGEGMGSPQPDGEGELEGEEEEGEMSWLERARARTAEVLQERKKMKRRLGLAAQKFNSGSKGWLQYAQELGLIPTPATPAATAGFLKSTLLLDKRMLGDYLSRGPADKYPFNAKVLEEYVKLFDMREKSFVEALRAFLKEFRLPGEAQCIDRLMEAFATQLHQQGGKGSGRHPFVNADAAFTMAFSAIMLNTDLHNPQIVDHRRMSLNDFIRNNRQINGGEDLPREFLEEVYKSIREHEIQVHRDHVSMAADGLGIDYTVHWDGILNRSNNVASASFTPARAARKHLFPAGVHERDMLLSMTGPASEAMRAVFLRTTDDLLVLGCLRGFRSHARACVYLGLVAPFDSALVFCFQRGLEYATAAAHGAAGPPLPEVLKNPGLPDVADIAACAPFASGCVVHRDLLALKCGLELARTYAHCVSSAWGPLLECLFAFADLQALPARLTDVDDFGDAQGNPLPPSVFARRCRDRARSGQNALLSQSQSSKGRISGGNITTITDGGGGGAGGGGLWGSLSGVLFSRAGEGLGGGGRRGAGTAAEASIGAIAEVVRAVQLEQLFPQTKDLPLEVVEGLLSALLTIRDPGMPRRTSSPAMNASATSSGGSSTPPPAALERTHTGGSSAGGGVLGGREGRESEGLALATAAVAAASFEAHAVLALELASRVVLANRHRVSRLWPSLHCYLARVLGGEGSVSMTRMPFLVERAMVTVLRACIHMLDREDMGALLLRSLKLLLSLPPNFVLPLSNRLASGLLILIQANASALSLPSAAEQWELIATLMEKALAGPGGRGFVLEALVFVVTGRVGLLGRHNVMAVQTLLTWLARGVFGGGQPDFSCSLQACAALEAMTSALLQEANHAPPPQAQPRTNTIRVAASTANAAASGEERDGEGGEKGDSGNRTSSSPGFPTGMAAAGGGVIATLSRDEAEGLWLSTLRTLGALSGSAFPKLAKGAADSLERLVLELHGIRPPAWGTAFAELLLELPVRLLPPSLPPRAGEYVRGTWNEEVCLRCCTILSRAFLHHLQALASLPEFPKLWLETVGLLSRNVAGVGSVDGGDVQDGSPGMPGGVGGGASGTEGERRRGGVVAESCQQILTNMIMVVAYAGLLGSQSKSEEETGDTDDTGPGDASGGGPGRGRTAVGDPRRLLLQQTRQILEPLCPGLRPLLRGLSGGEDLPAEEAEPTHQAEPQAKPSGDGSKEDGNVPSGARPCAGGVADVVEGEIT